HDEALQHRAPTRRTWAWRRECLLDPPAQARGRRKMQLRDRHGLPPPAISAQLRGATGAILHMHSHFARVAGPDPAPHSTAKQDFGFTAVHFGVPSSATQAWRSKERARAKRDITVPRGTPTTSAISRYDKSLISRSTIASRNGCGRSATRRRMVAASRCWTISVSGDS